jgi:sirohydrochlorin cobaltochelatase
MELCSPTLEETIEKIVKEDKDITKIGIVPFFLFEGIHIKEDIPEIIEKLSEEYKNIEFSFGKPLGADPILADILLKRAEEIL